jgi:hypothetical protein
MIRGNLLVPIVGLLIGLAGNAMARAVELKSDGWHSWEVPAGAEGRNACCYRSKHGAATVSGCDLDERGGGFTLGDCETPSGNTRIYVRIDNGKVADLHALSASCPVRTSTEVRDHGEIASDESIAWLRGQLDGNAEIAEDALVAIAMHSDEVSFAALRTVLEDRSRDKKMRENALFWLAQSGSEQAYRYLDRLLSAR